MPDSIPSCFRGCSTGVSSTSKATGPSISTSIYETHLGRASLIWSRNVFGITLHAYLHLTATGEHGEDSPLRLQIKPWLLWKRRGTRRFYFKIGPRNHVVDVSWDLTRARFPSAGSPEPCSGFSVSFTVDGGISLVAGNVSDEARRKMKAIRRSPAILLSRRERVLFKGDLSTSTYRTALRFMGKDREIGIEISGKELDAVGMTVLVDGTNILQVRPLRWKFRGSERVTIDGTDGPMVLISWDLHGWFFRCKEKPSPSTAAILVFSFEGSGEDNGVCSQKAVEIPTGSARSCRGLMSGYIGGNRNWSASGSVGGGGAGEDGKTGRKKSLMKTISLSSTSSTSSAASSSVVDWESQEEAEMRGFDGFTLVVHAWKC